MAIDTTLTPELISEGLAREFVNRVQQLRREAELDVTDRIHLTWNTPSAELTQAISEHQAWISGETLAEEMTRGDLAEHSYEVGGQAVAISLSVV